MLGQQGDELSLAQVRTGDLELERSGRRLARQCDRNSRGIDDEGGADIVIFRVERPRRQETMRVARQVGPARSEAERGKELIDPILEGGGRTNQIDRDTQSARGSVTMENRDGREDPRRRFHRRGRRDRLGC